jgi:hypothetical protein
MGIYSNQSRQLVNEEHLGQCPHIASLRTTAHFTGTVLALKLWRVEFERRYSEKYSSDTEETELQPAAGNGTRTSAREQVSERERL